MTPQQMRNMLEQTLDDHRLSRTERQALGKILDHLDLYPQTLSLYRTIAFELARDVLTSENANDVLDWLETVSKMLQSRGAASDQSARPEVYFSPEDDCPRRIASLIKTARASLDVCVFTITDDRISDELLEASRRGVRLRIITDDDKSEDRGSDVQRLERQGVPVRVDRSQYHMHHKFAIFDETRLLTGSYNWTRSAAQVNEENFLVTEDVRLIGPFFDLFERLWQKFE